MARDGALVEALVEREGVTHWERWSQIHDYLLSGVPYKMDVGVVVVPKPARAL